MELFHSFKKNVVDKINPIHVISNIHTNIIVTRTKRCDTSGCYRLNCRGNVRRCSSCPFSFCEYHYGCVATIATPVGGHVCEGKTIGAHLTNPINRITAGIDNLGKSSVDLNDLELVKILPICADDCYDYKQDHLKGLARLEHKGDTNHHGLASFRYGIYRITHGKHAGRKILAFRGTDTHEAWIANIDCLINDGNILRAAIRAAVKVAESNNVDFICGHSKGGCIAQGVCSYIGLPGAAFNSLGPYTPNIGRNLLEAQHYDGVRFEIHLIDNDFVNLSGGAAGPLKTHIGTPKVYDYKQGDPFDNHKSIHMMKYLLGTFPTHKSVIFVNKQSNKVMDVEGFSTDNCAKINAWDRNDGDNQKFHLERVDIKDRIPTYAIRNQHSGKAIDLSNPHDGVICQYDYHGRENQQWFFEHEGNGYYSIHSVQTNQVLTKRDDQIQAMRYSGGDDQLFEHCFL